MPMPETTFVPTPDGAGVLITGKKFFSTGSLAADLILVLGLLNHDFAAAFVPKDTAGLVIHEDWRAVGQRGTASGTTELHEVYVPWAMVIPKFLDAEGKLPVTNFLGPITGLCFAAIFVGTAKAALTQALGYVQTKARPLPWLGSGVSAAVEDPYILCEAGKLQARLSAAESLIGAAVQRVEAGLAARDGGPCEELTHLRAQASITAAQAKVVATDAALGVCQDIFKLCGARSGLAEEQLDRFWRDVRQLTIHDPVEYQARAIGEYLLQGRHPIPGFRF